LSILYVTVRNDRYCTKRNSKTRGADDVLASLSVETPLVMATGAGEQSLEIGAARQEVLPDSVKGLAD
jgi:hypothetical protein